MKAEDMLKEELKEIPSCYGAKYKQGFEAGYLIGVINGRIEVLNENVKQLEKEFKV